MKKIVIISSIILLGITPMFSQNVNIPDANFLNAPLEQGVDINADAMISYAEAEAVTNLDVSNSSISDLTGIEAFVNLTYLNCWNNQLTSLDVSKNTALNVLYLSNMPTLYQVCVWEMPFPPVGVTLDITGSPNIYFTTDCTVGINSLKTEKEFIIYPNPSNGIINIDMDYPLDSYIEIYNTKGRIIYSKPAISNQIKIDISVFPKGVYFVKVKQQGVLKVGKVVW